MNLSDHFTLEELTRTEVRSMVDENKSAAVEFIPSLKRVCDELLEPIRKLFNDVPVRVHSGYRCAELNKIIGGSPTSQHAFGQAADFDVNGRVDQSSLLADLRVIMDSDIRFNQLLIENGCLHIGLAHEDTVRGEVAYWNAGVKNIIREKITKGEENGKV